MNPGGLNSLVTVTAPRPEDVHTLPEILLVQTGLDICHAIEQLEALRVATVAEIDERAVSFDTLGFRSVKQWLAANTLLEVPAAARILALGRMLSRQPEIADAFNAGDISAEHAALIGKFCETPPRGMPNEALGSCRKVLLDAASGPAATTTTVRTCISRLERIFESDELPPSEDTERNEFHASKTLHGRVAVKGDLDAVTGEMLLTALSALTKPRNPIDDPAEERTPARQRADAFAEILRRYLDSGDAPIEGGERPHLSLHVKATDLARSQSAHEWTHPNEGSDLFGDKDIARMPHTGPLSIATARRIACDCHLTPIVMDDGVPLNLGRTSRTVSKKQRRALIARDHGCAFPGCGTPPAHCEGHHVKHWADGGPTDLDNLVLLCRYHHTLLHHSHWEVHIGPDRRPWFTPPSTVDPHKKPIPAHGRAGPRAA
ncbi:HNH endonuclease signature motif containing protein [Prescottella equi]|uniref:HNH endonuclease signature motif containing protein n=2 Tax=Rhodococcus hoagii TaxID=43767 RepID=UPI00197EF5BF|nr:HNH endonuclease signature motif containing protein [Prescottella equi]MBP0078817.1 HNH endonuclease [Prescottella equi]MBP0083242.1 HNH endonuclease [Prescottella equi]MBP0094493.1 HNH endonuclease [Prescottella equi]MBP0099450.1 HNH endonuclease [Prescottella equi]